MDFVVDSEEFKNAEVFLNKSYEDFKDDLDYWRTQIDQEKMLMFFIVIWKNIC